MTLPPRTKENRAEYDERDREIDERIDRIEARSAELRRYVLQRETPRHE